jgi:hypothetical protein
VPEPEHIFLIRIGTRSIEALLCASRTGTNCCLYARCVFRNAEKGEVGMIKVSSLMAAAALGALIASPPLFAQSSAAGQEMHQSGQAAQSAANSAGHSVEHVYHATKDELGDAALTTKVKTALMENKTTKPYTIHVKSDQGVVNLTGVVGSPLIAHQATKVASRVDGVHQVHNQLTWPSS